MDINFKLYHYEKVLLCYFKLRQKLKDEKQEYIVTVFGMGYTFGE